LKTKVNNSKLILTARRLRNLNERGILKNHMLSDVFAGYFGLENKPSGAEKRKVHTSTR